MIASPQRHDAALLSIARAGAAAFSAAPALWWAASPTADGVSLWLSAASKHGGVQVPPRCGERRCRRRRGWGARDDASATDRASQVD